jgi:hypothetical protein
MWKHHFDGVLVRFLKMDVKENHVVLLFPEENQYRRFDVLLLFPNKRNRR